MTTEVTGEIHLDRRDQQWHLDKRVPIALIFVLAGQLFGFGYFISEFSSTQEGFGVRLSNIENHQKDSFVSKDWAIGEHSVIRGELDHNADIAESIKGSVGRMEDKMDKMYDLLISREISN